MAEHLHVLSCAHTLICGHTSALFQWEYILYIGATHIKCVLLRHRSYVLKAHTLYV